MESENFTFILATWGAITGTIGTLVGLVNLYVRVKQFNEDQPILKCLTEFSFKDSKGQNKVDSKIVIHSIGKRDVTIDSVIFHIIPHTFFERVLKDYLWRKGKYRFSQTLSPSTTITEGKKKEFPISLPKGLLFFDIGKVQVVDQRGETWPVDWPSQSKIQRYYRNITFHDKEYKDGDILCRITGLIIGNSYKLCCLWLPSGPKEHCKTVTYDVQNRKEFDKKLKKITNNLTSYYIHTL